MTVNQVNQLWRRQQRERSVGRVVEQPLIDGLLDPNNHLSQIWDEEFNRCLLRRLLDSVEPEFAPATWKAFQLRVLEEKSTDEVARELGLSKNAVDIAKSRVLARLRAKLPICWTCRRWTVGSSRTVQFLRRAETVKESSAAAHSLICRNADLAPPSPGLAESCKVALRMASMDREIVLPGVARDCSPVEGASPVETRQATHPVPRTLAAFASRSLAGGSL